MIKVKRKKSESFESLYRRFGRRVQQSGGMLEARKIRFHTGDPSKNKKRTSAIRRLTVTAKREYLMRIGQLVERRRRRRR